MDLFIPSAMAEGGASSDGGPANLILLVIIFAIFYFLLMRPQMKRSKEHKKLVSALEKGEEVVTSGGILGKIIKLDEDIMTIEVDEGVALKVQRSSVSSLLPKGTIKHKKKKQDKKIKLNS